MRSKIAIPDLIDSIELAMSEYSKGNAKNLLRNKLESKHGTYRVMSALIEKMGVVGTKQGFWVSEFIGERSGPSSSEIISLYEVDSGRLTGLINSHYLNRLRTGAVGAISIKYLSNPSSAHLGLLGSGLHARTQALSCCAVRDIELVKVYSRNMERRDSFCKSMSQELGPRTNVLAVSSLEEALRESDVIIEATTATSPVVLGKELNRGVHVTSISGGPNRSRQIDDEAISMADLFVVDSKEQLIADMSGDVVEPIERGLLNPNSIVEIADIVSKKVEGRKSKEDVTLFKTTGMALFDIAAAKCVYDRIVAK